MMRRRLPIALPLVFVCLLGTLAALGVERSSAYRAAVASIAAADLQQHVDFLADEAREGREAGTVGGRAAGEYLAGQLLRMKIRPAGIEGGYFQPFGQQYRNVLAWIEGSDPELKQQYVLVGAHYDHVGRGTPQNSRGGVGMVHPGADDNASGTSVLLKIAEAFTVSGPPRRSVLLAFWDAEEKAMLGSKQWLARPAVPRERLVASINLDMVGRLRDDRVMLIGSRTGYGLRRLVAEQNGLEPPLRLDFTWQVLTGGDHYPFIEAGLPTLMFHTDLHDDYHRPSDSARSIDARGMERIARLAFAVAYELAERQQRPGPRPAGLQETPAIEQAFLRPAPLADRLGASWQETPGRGVRLVRVLFGSPAHRAGLQAGDQVLRAGDTAIASGSDLSAAVSRERAPMTVLLRRPGLAQAQQAVVHLEGEPMRLGLSWRVDEAEPGTVVLTQVVAGSPAAEAGLLPGDRIYQIGGRDFANDAEFAERAKSLPGPVMILFERQGRLQSVELHVGGTVRKAA